MHADLVMAIHFHQPIGNFDHVFERACDKCYIPFIKLLSKYPDIRMSFHFTGCLYEWIEKNRPEMMTLLSKMSKSSQIEIMGGGFYEPILPSIPYRDRLAQLGLMSGYVEKKFGYRPSGAWVAERVWEPELASVYHDAGIKYVILDDTHFLYAGIEKDATHGYYITEDNGKTVAVFPSDKVLRYHIPFKMPWECVNYFRSVMEKQNDPTFIYGDDGEKFGEWPGTYKWVYEEEWLRLFFDELVKQKDWLSTITFSECLAKKKPVGRVYLPTSSYEEMLEWALPAARQELYEEVLEEVKSSGREERYKAFLRGGFWRNFLTKYSESNQMNKKMLYVSNKFEKIKKKKSVKKELINEIEDNLYKGQCNCAYWHGVFGGLYLFHLRRAIYHHLIKSEALIDKASGGKAFVSSDVVDANADGMPEVILENKLLSVFLSPHDGGVIKELDLKTICQNFSNVMTRRKEAYHKKIVEKIKEKTAKDLSECKSIHDVIQVTDEGITEYLIYDWYERTSLIDHFLGEGTDIHSFSKASFHEEGDFVKGAYDFKIKKSENDVTIILAKDGKVGFSDVSLTKKISLSKNESGLNIEYVIKNVGNNMLDTIFAPEFNLAMPDADSDKYRFIINGDDEGFGPGSVIKKENVSKLKIHDDAHGLSCEMSFSNPLRLWSFPVKTVSQSEKAYELNYQGSAIIPGFRLALNAGEETHISIDLTLSDRTHKNKN